MQITRTGWRFFAYSIFGVVLLIIYQIVFMARTSANRDWDHLHKSQFTLQDVQRFVVSHDVGNGTREIPFKKSAAKPFKYVANASTPEGPVELSQFTTLFAYPGSVPRNGVVSFDRAQIKTVSEFEYLDDLVAGAKTSHYKLIAIETDAGWTPNFGLVHPKLPVIAVNGRLGGDRVTVAIDESPTDDTYEYTIDGYTDDCIIVGDSRAGSSSELFQRTAALFFDLSARGWRPFRTIRFVSFGQLSAEDWAQEHSSLLRKNAIAYIDCAATLSASPILDKLVTWALSELIEGGVLNTTDKVAYPSALMGGNAFLFKHGVPTVSTLDSDEFTGLLIATLAQSPILPYSVGKYATLIAEGCPTLAGDLINSAANFDKAVHDLGFQFTEEFPWYQFKAKFAAFRRRKVLNLKMHYFENHLMKKGRHVLFKSNKAHNGTELAGLDTCKITNDLMHKLRT